MQSGEKGSAAHTSLFEINGFPYGKTADPKNRGPRYPLDLVKAPVAVLSPKGAREVDSNYLSPRPFGGEGPGVRGASRDQPV